MASKTGCRENSNSVSGKKHFIHQILSFGLNSVYWQIFRDSDVTFLRVTFKSQWEALQDSAYLSGALNLDSLGIPGSAIGDCYDLRHVS